MHSKLCTRCMSVPHEHWQRPDKVIEIPHTGVYTHTWHPATCMSWQYMLGAHYCPGTYATDNSVHLAQTYISDQSEVLQHPCCKALKDSVQVARTVPTTCTPDDAMTTRVPPTSVQLVKDLCGRSTLCTAEIPPQAFAPSQQHRRSLQVHP